MMNKTMASTVGFIVVSVASLFASAPVLAQVGLSHDEKLELLRAHNYFRGRVNPVATNVEKMVSDHSL